MMTFNLLKKALIVSGATLICTGASAQFKYDVDEFITEKQSNKLSIVGSSNDGNTSPVDLDFNPTKTKELWVINMRTANVGGNTVTYNNVGTGNQQALMKIDGNARHFMSLPTALAFGDQGDWASSAGVYDANFSNGRFPPFTGPTLWSSDMNIYARYAGPGTNGSHLDMLHGSPYSMGIAWYKGNEYFVFDGENEHLVWYDFALDHGPGMSDHDDGRIRRYPEVTLKRDGTIPSHMEVDADRKWLYINDVGNARIIRVDLTSGNIKGRSSTPPSETLAENNDMENVTWEVVASTGLNKPCGLDLTKDRLLITDNATSELIIYDISRGDGTFPEVGRISLTGYTDVMGVKLDDENAIWFVDKTARVVVRIDNENVDLKDEDGVVASNEENVITEEVQIFPNPTQNVVQISNLSDGLSQVSILDLSGQVVLQESVSTSSNSLDLKELNAGMYVIKIMNESHKVIQTTRLIKE